MKNLMILIRSFFLLRPRFLSTIFFIPILYGIGWALSQPLLLFNFEKDDLSLIGTIITFLLFIFLLPYWFYIKRNKSSAWIILGITKDKFLKNFFNFFKNLSFVIPRIIQALDLFRLIWNQYGSKKIKSKKVIIVPIKDKFSFSKLNNKSGWDKAQPMP